MLISSAWATLRGTYYIVTFSLVAKSIGIIGCSPNRIFGIYSMYVGHGIKYILPTLKEKKSYNIITTKIFYYN